MSLSEPTLVTLTPRWVAAVREDVALAGIRQFFDRAFGSVFAVLAEQGIVPAGPPVGVYWGQPTDTIDVACGVPTVERVAPAGDVVALELPGGLAAEAVHEGPYDQLSESYQALAAWMSAQGVTPEPLMWEAYETEPTPDADPEAMRTRITWPVQSLHRPD